MIKIINLLALNNLCKTHRLISTLYILYLNRLLSLTINVKSNENFKLIRYLPAFKTVKKDFQVHMKKIVSPIIDNIPDN